MEENRGYVEKLTKDGVPRHFTVLNLDKAGQITEKTSTEMTGALKNHLVPTDMGMLIVDFLDKHFDEVMNYRFTAEVEDKLDDVANGKRNWVEMLDKFYDPFHEDVVKTMAEAERVSGERVLGKDPVSGKTVLVRMGKYGPIAQIGAPDELGENEKPAYGNLQKGQSIETITLEDSLRLFDLPKNLGEFENMAVSVGIGRFGPFVKFGDTFVSMPRGDQMTLKSMCRAA